MLREWDVAVVDLETTGVELGYSHRVVEVAVVRYGRQGQVVGDFATLVNPERDIGNTHLHGIAARDVRDAPTFAEVAGTVLGTMAGCIVVAHNANFEARFLKAEFNRCSVELPPLASACTLQLASHLVTGLRSRKLRDICHQVGIDLRQPHTALDDARATGALFEHCVDCLGGWGVVSLSELGCSIRPTPRDLWPTLPTGGRVYTREHARRTREDAGRLMATVIGRLPQSGASEPVLLPYMAALDKVLEDRRVTASEARQLLDFASGMGMTQRQMREAHRLYLRDLIQVAIEDQVISSLEDADLQNVRILLNLSRADYDAAMAEAAALAGQSSPQERVVGVGTDNLVGRSVCFTGSLQGRRAGEAISRGEAEALARAHGYGRASARNQRARLPSRCRS